LPTGDPPPQSATSDVKEGEEEQEAGESARGAVFAAKPEPLAGREPNRVVAVSCLPLLPLLRAVVSFHADDLSPSLFTDACASARGH
jgi:hypothetical protein